MSFAISFLCFAGAKVVLFFEPPKLFATFFCESIFFGYICSQIAMKKQ